MKVLITGATGFVGSHMIDFLLKKCNIDIYATKRRRSDMANVSHVKNDVTWIDMDLTDGHSLYQTIKTSMPDYIFHLGAQSFVPMSWSAPQETFISNAIGTVNILEAVRNLELNSRIHIAGSSEEYGFVTPDETPITEDNQLRPLSPYGVSKVATDLFARQYHRSYGLDVVVTRAFNHTGPRRGEMFVTSNFAKQIVEIEKGRKPVIYVGNLNAQRDFSDVRDVVRAYWLALEKGKTGEVYNICSEKAITIKKLLDNLLSLSKVEIEIKEDPTRMRPSDVEVLLGSCSKFKEETGWAPEISFEKTLEDLMNYWREKL